MHPRLERWVSRVLAAAAGLLLVASSQGLDPAGATETTHHGLVVEGYVVGWGGGAAAYLSDRRTVDTIGVDGVEVTSDAGSVSHVPGPARKALHAAHLHHDSAELLLSNYSDPLGDFDPGLARRLLGSAVHRRDVAAALAGVVRRQGWDGIQIDLESLGRADGPGLTAFARRLRADLPGRARLSMAVMAEGSKVAYRRHGYQLARLDAVDRFVLMAYDQHGPGWSGPGPVGALPWARHTVRPMVEGVGRGRVDLGIAGYGYLWRPDGSGRSVSDARARELAGDAARWHPRAGEWSARTDGGALWWSDHRSYERRLRLARRLGLHGVAVWQLGSADPLRN
jgi:spore germination protein